MVNYILRRKWVGNPTTLKIASFSNKFSVHSTNDGEPPNPQGGTVIRWGTTSTIPGEATTVNTAKAIHKVFDKRASRKLFADLGWAPKTYISFSEWLNEADLSKTYIMRPKHHIRGMDMHIIKNVQQGFAAYETITNAEDAENREYYISEYIPKVREYRLFVVSGRVLGVCEKIPVNKNDVSWGCADEEGGAFKYIKWSNWDLAMTLLAVESQKKLGADFAAVDMIEDADGGFYILELNTAPSMTDYWAECFAKAFDYIIDNGKDFIPVGSDNSWKSYIHPSLSDQAKVS